jgi:hypothetical protein
MSTGMGKISNGSTGLEQNWAEEQTTQFTDNTQPPLG